MSIYKKKFSNVIFSSKSNRLMILYFASSAFILLSLGATHMSIFSSNTGDSTPTTPWAPTTPWGNLWVDQRFDALFFLFFLFLSLDQAIASNKPWQRASQLSLLPTSITNISDVNNPWASTMTPLSHHLANSSALYLSRQIVPFLSRANPRPSWLSSGSPLSNK